MINYILHFIGPFIFFHIFYRRFYRNEWRENLRIRKSYVSGFLVPLIWEAAQLDGWWNIRNYKLSEFVNYYWTDTGLDLAASVFGILLGIAITYMGNGNDGK